MKKIVLLLLTLLSANFAIAQGSKAQTDTHPEGNAESVLQGQGIRNIRIKSNSLAGTPSWQQKKISLIGSQYCYPPAISKEYTTLHFDASNTFFNRSLIIPSPSTAQLLRNQNPHAPVASVSTNSLETPSGEKIFSNEQATFSSIYPNPASTYAFIDYALNGNIQESKVVLYNLLGTPIREYLLNREEKKLRIPTFELESGFYYYTLFVDGKSLVTRRLVVKH